MHRESLPFIDDPDLARFIDSACDRFSAALGSQSQPRVEDYLESCPDAARSVLFQELLALEFEHLAQHSQLLSVDTYIARFPESAQTVEAVYKEITKQASKSDSTLAFATNGIDSTLRFELGSDLPSASLESAGAESLPPAYAVIRRLGQGGMGEVYLARQDSADRLVAIKIIRPDRMAGGKFDSQIVARFRQEIKAAARLEHDHVVNVYDVGEWQGQPFYTMRYVAGETLRQRLNDGPLEGRAAAAMIRDVASAIAAAHKAGILHRDLKPHNILIEQDTNRPLVADFGLAKVMGGAEEMTVAGAVFGSPPYMAPEQALDASQAKEASDVYGIGATLYHALTGRPPFQAASVPETLQQVMHAEPLAVRKLNPAVAVDLETICMKCLAKEACHRYPSASALADDLQCFLDDRPISARPAGSLEKSWRWVRRNRRLASLLAALIVSVLVGSLGIFVQWRRSEQNFTKAENNFTMARNRLHLGREVMRELLVNVSKEELRDVPQIEPLRQELLQKALRYYDKFIEEAQGDPVLQREQAIAQTSLAEIHVWLGNFSQASQELAAAKQQVLQLLAKENHQAEESELRSALADIHSHLGVVAFRAGNLEQAEQEFLAFQKVSSQLPSNAFNVNLDPAVASDNLASLYREKGELRRAKLAYQQSLDYLNALDDTNRGSPAVLNMLAGTNYNLGLVLRELGNLAEAEQASQDALQAIERWAELAPESVVQQRLYAQVLQGLGWLRNAMGNPQNALENLLRAAEIEEKLVDEHPQVPRYRVELARLQSSIVFTYGLLNDSKNTAAMLDKAIEGLEELLAKDPDIAEYAGLLGEVLTNRGWALQATDPKQSAVTYERAIKLLMQALQSAPENQHLLSMLGQAYHSQGILHSLRLNDLNASRTAYDQAYGIRKKLVERVASNTLLDGLAYTCLNSSWNLLELGEQDAAELRITEAIQLRQQIYNQSPSPEKQFTLAEVQFDAAQFMYACDAPNLARPLLEQAVSAAEELIEQHAGVSQIRNFLAISLETWCYDRVLHASDDVQPALQRAKAVLTRLEDTVGDTDSELQQTDAAIVRLRVLRSFMLSRFLAEFDVADQELANLREPTLSELQTFISIAQLEVLARRGEPALAIEKLSQIDTGSSWDWLPMARIYLLAARACVQDETLAESARGQACEQYRRQATECMQQLSNADSLMAKRMLAWDNEFAEIRSRVEQVARDQQLEVKSSSED